MSHHNHCYSFIESHWSFHLLLRVSLEMVRKYLGCTNTSHLLLNVYPTGLCCGRACSEGHWEFIWLAASTTSTEMLLVCTEASSIFQLPRYPQSSQSCSKAHLCQSTQLGALALLFRLWGPKLPFLTLQHSFILSCLKAMLEKCHLLVLVEISCTFHFEYNLGERFAEHYLTWPIV
mgnify:CR=1 FL=1